MQEKACREYCEREGYDVAGIFVDEGESAKTIDRPKFKELVGFCRNKKNRVNVVVVNSISRFARDKYSHFTVRTLLSRLNITLRSVRNRSTILQPESSLKEFFRPLLNSRTTTRQFAINL